MLPVDGETTHMSTGERKAACALAGLYALRMLGLFMVLPVFALYAEDLAGATPLLTGVAIGIYGLTQACLQIPFGMLSDRFGRKRLIIIGLLLFAAGSVVAALADSILVMMVGRALQGAGAIAAVVLALAADLSREEQRTKIMAVIGISIGVSFALSMVLGPALHNWIGIKGIFWLTAVMAVMAVLITHFVIPQPIHLHHHRDTTPVPALFKHVLRDTQLLRLDVGILTLHMVLTATFVAVPLALRDGAGFPAHLHWLVYLSALVLSIMVVIPSIILAEKYGRVKPMLLAAILALGFAELGLASFYHSLGIAVTLIFVFFTAFNLLEASLPSLISKLSPPNAKGTAMGVYSSSQFLGAFFGGALGGWMHGLFGLQGVFAFAALGTLFWFGVAYTMQPPRLLSSYSLHLGVLSDNEASQMSARLSQIRGVVDAVVIAADGVAYLKVDRDKLDKAALQELSIAKV
ncbi:MAG: MFS transporter [Candidatus Competibacteraceae bacterium]|jgi:MFS family permease|nr:MFS transporter [Candidatus Competibacteraceae bacterium]